MSFWSGYAKSTILKPPTPEFHAAAGQIDSSEAPVAQYRAVVTKVLEGKVVSARQLYSR